MSFSNYVSHVFVDLVRFSSQIYTNLTFFQGESAMSQLQRNPRKKKKIKKKRYVYMYVFQCTRLIALSLYSTKINSEYD